MAIRNDISPGKVVFFAGKQNPAEKLTIEKLQKIVYHIAIVTSVEKDENGDVTSYRMMHGRSDGKLASRTQSASVDDQKGRPPLGNDYSQLVAIVDFVPADMDAMKEIVESVPAENKTPAVAEIEEPEIPEVTSTTTKPVDDPSAERFRAGISDDRMSIVLENIAQELTAQKLAYDRTLGQDCSGIFHKIKDELQKKLPTFKDFDFPQFNTDRNTRQIAHWYSERGNLHLVNDALADQNRIRPGTVLFFGRTDEKYNSLNIDMLSNPGKWVHDSATGKGKIYHIAVVTAVKTDANGKRRCTIMHGRNSRHVASRTEVNYDGPGGFKKQFAKFPFGNWNQQLVAIAHIATPK